MSIVHAINVFLHFTQKWYLHFVRHSATWQDSKKQSKKKLRFFSKFPFIAFKYWMSQMITSRIWENKKKFVTGSLQQINKIHSWHRARFFRSTMPLWFLIFFFSLFFSFNFYVILAKNKIQKPSNAIIEPKPSNGK